MIADAVRPSALFATQVVAVIIVFGLLWRIAAAYFSDSAVGRAMAVIY